MRSLASQDERIIGLRRTVNAKAFGILYFGLIIVMMRRMFFLHELPPVDLLILYLVTSVYLLYNYVVSGTMSTSYANKRSFAKISIISAAISASVFFALNLSGANVNMSKYILIGIIYFVVFVSAQALIYKLSEFHANKDIE